MEKKFYVYILTSSNCKTLYVGVTDNISRRTEEHKSGTVEGFTSKYKVNKLVYYEVYNNADTAILREKQLKSWNRKHKTDLISLHNPDWNELEI